MNIKQNANHAHTFHIVYDVQSHKRNDSKPMDAVSLFHSSPEMKVADESGDHYNVWLHLVRPSLTEHDCGHVLGEDGKTLTHCDKRISQRSISELLLHLLQPTSDPLSPHHPIVHSN